MTMIRVSRYVGGFRSGLGAFIAMAVLLSSSAHAQSCVPTLVGTYGTGIAWTVEIEGTTAYLGVNSTLHILDVSDPTDPVLLGSLELPLGYLLDITVEGDIAYVAAHGDLWIVDVKDKTNPVLRGSYGSNIFTGITLVGTTAYLAEQGRLQSGLRILDVSNPFDPESIGWYETPANPYGVAVVGTTAYVADHRDGGLQIIDVTNPKAPSLLGWYDTPGDATDVVVVDAIAYVSDAKSVQMIDVSDPVNPFLLSEFETYDAKAVRVIGGTAYVADTSGTIILDVRNPRKPISIGMHNTAGLPLDVAIDNETAYVSTWFQGLQVIDLSTCGANPCYADCDHSTGQGELDVFDFLCFQDAFVTNERYACDCDTSTGSWRCDVFDFLCFQDAFVRGCR